MAPFNSIYALLKGLQGKEYMLDLLAPLIKLSNWNITTKDLLATDQKKIAPDSLILKALGMRVSVMAFSEILMMDIFAEALNCVEDGSARSIRNSSP